MQNIKTTWQFVCCKRARMYFYMSQGTSTKVSVEKEVSVMWNALWPVLFLNHLRQVQVLRSTD